MAAAPPPHRTAAFRKPADPSAPTAHLFVASVAGVEDSAVVAAVADAAGIDEQLIATQRPFANNTVVFVSLPDRECAARALGELRSGNVGSLPAAAGRTVRYAEAVSLPPPAPPPFSAVCETAEELNVPGVTMLRDAISEEEEARLLAALATEPRDRWQVLARRRVIHFGHRFDYETRSVSNRGADSTEGSGETAGAGSESGVGGAESHLHVLDANDESGERSSLPPFLAPLAERFAALPQCVSALAAEGVRDPRFDQVTANEYPPGAGISPHVDTHSSFHAPVLSLSCGSDAVMEFRRPAAGAVGGDSHSGDVRRLRLRRRSLVVMCGEGRYGWHHYIPHRKYDLVGAESLARSTRTSITFRRVRTGRCCACAWPSMCDSQAGEPDAPGVTENTVGITGARSAPCGAPTGAARAAAASAGGTPARPAGLPAAPERDAEDADVTYGADSSNLSASERRAVRKAARKRAAAARRAEERARRDAEERARAEEAAATAARALSRMSARSSDGTSTSADSCPPTSLPLPPMPRDDGAARAEIASAAPPPIELAHVRQVYDAIAGHFSATRYVRWPQVTAFLETLEQHSLVADVGAGNGKYLGSPGGAYRAIGMDSSAQLCAIAARRSLEVVVADALGVPLRSGVFDAAISIAVLHHLSTTARRAAAIVEIARLLRPGGRALVTVWASQQSAGDLSAASKDWKALEANVACDAGPARDGDGGLRSGGGGAYDGNASVGAAPNAGSEGTAQDLKGRDVLVPWHVPFHRPEARGALNAVSQPGGGAPGYMEDSKNSIVFDRYYHAFEEGELEGIVRAADCGMGVERAFYDKGNWCCVLVKAARG